MTRQELCYCGEVNDTDLIVIHTIEQMEKNFMRVLDQLDVVRSERIWIVRFTLRDLAMDPYVFVHPLLQKSRVKKGDLGG